jgi:hypothetical protein
MDLCEKLLEKSKEAFAMAIELYNKPTIRYRVEGFSIFICNAWELMLKAHMINAFSEKSIYYKDNQNRTLSLENCIQKVFTNNKDPLRLNLEKIIELRNISTHLITEEYEMVYVPLFQSCILNYNEKMGAFHNIDMTAVIPQNFLTLSVSMRALSEADIIAKYPEEIATRLISQNNEIAELQNSNNHAFSIRIEHHHYLTKNSDKATSFIKVDNQADASVKIIKEMKDINDTHKFSAKKCIETINNRIKKEGLNVNFLGKEKFNIYHFGLFLQYYGIKNNERFCYAYRVQANPQYSYSIQAIDFIIDEIKKDPHKIIQTIKEHVTKNKLTPGAKEFSAQP